MIKGFRDFLLRGNVVALAVAVVVGTAFTGIVTKFTEGLILPVIAALGGTKAPNGLGFSLRHGSDEIEKTTFLDFGIVLNAAVTFLITVAVVYFVFVLPMNIVTERIKRGQQPVPEDPTPEVALLKEIRDLLRDRPTDR
jgi:large conductance mechanosensitive channel